MTSEPNDTVADAAPAPQPACVSDDDLVEMIAVLDTCDHTVAIMEMEMARSPSVRDARDAVVRAVGARQQVMARFARVYALTAADTVQDDGTITRGAPQ